MSCHCNKSISHSGSAQGFFPYTGCHQCQSIQQQPCYCQGHSFDKCCCQVQCQSQGQDHFDGQWDSHFGGCGGCRGCRTQSGCERHSDGCDRQHKKDRKKDKKDKRKKSCNKCDRRNCECVEFFPTIRTECGCLAATLEKTAEPNLYSAAGQVITYFYTITNVGNVPIQAPIQICDDKLGTQIINCTLIWPGQSATFYRTHTITTLDLEVSEVTNASVAFIKVKKHKWLITNPAESTITRVVTV